MTNSTQRLSIEKYADGILKSDRVILAKAITLVESTLPSDQTAARRLLDKILPHTGNSVRLGITGVPGVGKSSFIESFGKMLANEGRKIAVLTIDPSSQLTRGSILGDKTRMEELSKHANVFIRPTPSGSILGGVAGSTREAMMLCEAAGFEVIIIETVGVGQSEVSVRGMVDFFLLLMLAGAGDELQGMKKGIMEMADGMAITKADGDNVGRATEAQAEYQHALHLYPPRIPGWSPKVLTCSAYTGKGIPDVWKMVEKFQSVSTTSGYFEQNRARQNVSWFRDSFEQLLRADYSTNERLKQHMTTLEEKISQQQMSVQSASADLLKKYHSIIKESN